MNGTLAGMIVMVSALVLNWTSLYVSFPKRRRLSFYVVVVVLCSPIAFVFSYFVTGVTSPIGLNGLILLPFCIWMLKGRFFQTTFAVILQMLLTVLEHALCGVIVRMFVPWQSSEFYLYWLIGSLALYVIHALILLKWGQEFYNKLYAFGHDTEWALYSFGAAFSFVFMIVMYNVLTKDWQIILMFLFVLWEFSVFCFAIISTHEKTKQRLDAEFARGIVSTGQSHYQRMDEMYEKLRTLRHDYKYHLNAAQKMLRSGSAEEAGSYLSEVERQMSGYELKKYCSNSVISALVASYDERCAELGISFKAKIAIPETLTVPNYDLCIILGNLLENAVEACAASEPVRVITLETHTKASQLLVMVKNSFSGEVKTENGELKSAKSGGGFGLRSVKEVIDRHGGDFLTEWEGGIFTAYAAVSL